MSTAGYLVAYVALHSLVSLAAAGRIRRGGGEPFPALRANTRTASGFVERLLVVQLAFIYAYVLAAIAAPAAVGALPGLEPPPVVRAAGLTLLALSLGVTVACIAWMGNSWRVGIARERLALVVSGPYRLVRHPIYLGMLLGILAVVLLAPNVVVTAWGASAASLVAVQARLEEDHLVRTHPEYAAYAARAGRFLPLVGRLRRPEEVGR